MLRMGLPRFCITLHAAPLSALQASNCGRRQVQQAAVSLLDFRPQPHEPRISRCRTAVPLSHALMPELRALRRAHLQPRTAASRVRHFSSDALPPSFASVCSPETTSYLRNPANGAEVFLVGTAHISQASADEVRKLIRLVQPDTVLVELDKERAARLQSGETASLIGFLKRALPGVLLPSAQWGANAIQLGVGSMYQVLRMVGFSPGGEFKAAIEEAAAVRARVVFGDMPVDRTARSLAKSVGFWDFMKLVLSEPPDGADKSGHSSSGADGSSSSQGSGSGSGNSSLGREKHGSPEPNSMEAKVEAMKTRKQATAMRAWMRGSSPKLAAVLIDERDAFMVDQLQALSGKVVAVVGLAHLDGIEEKWGQQTAEVVLDHRK